MKSDVTIDIHATNKPSVPFAVSENDEKHRNVFRWFEPKNVLTDPTYIFGGGVVAIDEYANSKGKVGVCFETGWVEDTTIIPQVKQSIIHYLTDVGIFSGVKISPPAITTNIYQITDAIIQDERPFFFVKNHGLSSFEPIEINDVIGHRGNEPVTASETGVLVFPKLPEYQQSGKPVCYLAKKIG